MTDDDFPIMFCYPVISGGLSEPRHVPEPTYWTKRLRGRGCMEDKLKPFLRLIYMKLRSIAALICRMTENCRSWNLETNWKYWLVLLWCTSQYRNKNMEYHMYKRLCLENDNAMVLEVAGTIFVKLTSNIQLVSIDM